MDLKIDSNSDLQFVNGDLVLLDGADEVAQRISINLRTLKGECFMDPEIGVPYIQRIFKKNTSIELITSLFRNAILADPGVSELLTLSFDFAAATRTFTLNFSVRTTTDEVLTFPEFIING